MSTVPISALIVILTASSTAFAADQHAGSDHNQIQAVRGEVHGTLDTFGLFGVGGRVEFPLVSNGLVNDVNDELALSLGADLFFSPVYSGWYNNYAGGSYLILIAAVQWNFYLGDDWSVFPELGIALHASLDQNGWDNGNGRSYGWIYPALDAGVGARYHFSSRVALLLRASTPGGLQVGVVF